MKTNQIIIRKMGDFDVFQRTKDGMFNATELINQWNKANPKNQKELKEFFKNQSTKNFIEALVEEREKTLNSHFPVESETLENEVLPNGGKSTPLESIEKQRIPKWVLDTTKGRYGSSWMDSLLYIKFAMWLNPRFEVKVIHFVYDSLIEYRNKLGDQWGEFTSCCQRIGCSSPDDYKLMARCLNCAILGQYRQREQRNELTEEEAKELYSLAEQFISAVKHKYIKTIRDGQNFFKQEYLERLNDSPFQEVL